MQEIEVAVGLPGVSTAVDAARVTASVHGNGTTTVILGHGAGSNRRNPFLIRAAERLADSGRRVVLPNFPYTESGRRVPDPPALLEASVQAVTERVRAEWAPTRLVLGGRSMGGRMASQAVAKGLEADALVFLAYPLHPPGQPEKLRDRHLGEVRRPMLFVQGTRDDFARLDLLEPLIARLDLATLLRVEGGDHSFGVLKRSGREPRQVESELFAALIAWLDTHAC